MKRYIPRVKEIEAWKWAVEDGEFSIEKLREVGQDIAQWCDGAFWQDNRNPEDADKTYYWMIFVPDTGTMRPGEYLIKMNNGRFVIMIEENFEEQWEELTV